MGNSLVLSMIQINKTYLEATNNTECHSLLEREGFRGVMPFYTTPSLLPTTLRSAQHFKEHLKASLTITSPFVLSKLPHESSKGLKHKIALHPLI